MSDPGLRGITRLTPLVSCREYVRTQGIWCQNVRFQLYHIASQSQTVEATVALAKFKSTMGEWMHLLPVFPFLH